MKRKSVKIIVLLVVGVLVAGAVYLKLRPNQVAAATNVSTATVQRGSLTATVNSAGNIQTHQSADLSFGQSGTVKKINVKVGDRVKTGDVLAELDTTDLNLQLRSAQVNLKNAQDQLAQTKNPNTEQDIANARAQLESAQAAYDKVAAGASAAKLASAQAQVASAQAAYDAAVKSAASSDSSLVAASSTYEKARIAVQQAQGEYDKVSWRGDVAASGQAQSLQSATIDYNSAKAAYDALVATSKSDASSKVASAAASLRSAQASLDEIKNQVTTADLKAAQSTLTQAKNNLETLLAGPDANSLDIAQNGVETAQIALDQIKLKLQQAQVVAPFDGTVTTDQQQDRPDRQRHGDLAGRPGSPGHCRQHGRGGCEQDQGGAAGRNHPRRGHRSDADGHGLADRPGGRAEQRRRQLPGHRGHHQHHGRGENRHDVQRQHHRRRARQRADRAQPGRPHGGQAEDGHGAVRGAADPDPGAGRAQRR